MSLADFFYCVPAFLFFKQASIETNAFKKTREQNNNNNNNVDRKRTERIVFCELQCADERIVFSFSLGENERQNETLMNQMECIEHTRLFTFQFDAMEFFWMHHSKSRENYMTYSYLRWNCRTEKLHQMLAKQMRCAARQNNRTVYINRTMRFLSFFHLNFAQIHFTTFSNDFHSCHLNYMTKMLF